jgi:hypothetical protein
MDAFLAEGPRLDVYKILKELREERQRIEEAILPLGRLAVAKGQKRRGRPPKWMTEARNAAGNDRKVLAMMSRTSGG